jgi:hypothetical protein
MTHWPLRSPMVLFAGAAMAGRWFGVCVYVEGRLLRGVTSETIKVLTGDVR